MLNILLSHPTPRAKRFSQQPLGCVILFWRHSNNSYFKDMKSCGVARVFILLLYRRRRRRLATVCSRPQELAA